MAAMCGRCGCVTEGSSHEAVRAAVVEGVVEPGLLLLLAEHDGYGYELAAELDQRELVSGPVPPARVYEILNRLEEEGAVVSQQEDSPSGPDRRRYRITQAGQDRLDRWATALRLSERHLNALLGTYNRQRRRASRDRTRGAQQTDRSG